MKRDSKNKITNLNQAIKYLEVNFNCEIKRISKHQYSVITKNYIIDNKPYKEIATASHLLRWAKTSQKTKYPKSSYRKFHKKRKNSINRRLQKDLIYHEKFDELYPKKEIKKINNKDLY